jgi:predicted transcriptional regulator
MMKKKEIVYRTILDNTMQKKQASFTQLDLSKKLKFSLSTINNALKPLEEIGAIEKKPRSFIISDVRKALLFWASVRRLSKDIIYSTRSESSVQKIEGEMPAGVVFTAYSGYRLFFNEAPADYSEVYAYADSIEEIKERFPERKGPKNLFILQKDCSAFASNIR